MQSIPLQLLRTTLGLWRQHWPPLVLLVLVGYLANEWLLRLVVEAGLRNHVLGLSLLAPLVVLELAIVIAMFHVLRPSLPALGSAAAAAPADPAQPARRGDRLASALALSLVPFFAYYAAWGLLGETVREYSLAGLARDPLGQYGPLLDALKSSGLLISVAASWLLRRYAKAREARKHSPGWQALIVLCEANWVFIGLFVITRGKEVAMKWLESRVVWQYFGGASADLAQAPLAPGLPTLMDTAWNATQGLFLAALLPLVWLAITALIFGRELGEKSLLSTNRRLEKLVDGYDRLPAALRQFGDDVVKGYRTRYVPVANSLRLTLQAGLPLVLAFCVGYRGLEWLSAQAWLLATQLIGPHVAEFWRPAGNALALFVGSPLGTGASLLFEPLRICLLAATLELGVAAWLRRHGALPVPAAAPASAQLQPQ